MDTLTLSIENHATLENGGPVTLTLAGKGAQIGRKPGNDWVLPDPSRHISGHHFDVSYENGGYVLTDVSSNGVFLHGERYRLGGPHQIADGDRFTVGQYIIKAALAAPQAAAPPVAEPAPAPPAAPAAPEPPVPPVTPAPPPPQQPQPTPAPQPAPEPPPDPNAPMFAPPVEEGGPVPPAPPPPASPPPASPVTSAPVSMPPGQVPETSVGDEFDDIWGDLGGSAGSSGAQSVQAPPTSPVIQPGSVPGATMPPNFATLQSGTGGISMPPIPQPAAAPPPPEPVAPVPPEPPAPVPPPPQPAPPPQPVPQPPVPQAHGLGEGFSDPVQDAMPVTAAPGAMGQQGGPAAQGVAQGVAQGAGDAFLAAFLQSAGIDPARLQIPPEELGRILGQIARIGTTELMRMLQERTAVKVFVASEDRTMRSATGNNPMKFETDIGRAFDMLFVEPRPGYQTGGDAFANALEDVRRHQAGVMASVQPALAEMLEGLSPPEVEADSGGGMFSGGGRKAWEEYTKRWETRAAQGDNGMLDAFIKAFGRHYGDALRKL
ncbi:MAG: type VI secretion system-associated FHA domain protein [Pseudomonadota bacterium]